jgi:tricorn protease
MLVPVVALLFAAQSQTPPEMRLMRYPCVHNGQVVFTYASDLWVSDIDGGFARRLTSHPGLEQKAYYSPDGSQIAFTGQYDGGTDVYVMPAEGGEPKRLTYEPGTNVCEGWTPDGKIAYVSAYASINDRQTRLWLIDPKGGLPQSTPVLEAADVSFSPDGHKVAYNRQASNRFNWRRYRGGSQGVISILDLQAGTYKELPHERENSWNPMWIGNSIYYVSDKNEQTVNLYRYDLGSGKSTELTHYSDADIHWPESDGRNIVFERDGYLFRYEISLGKVSQINPTVRGDLVAARPQLRRLGAAISDFDISPSGARVVIEARGHLFSVPAKHGETREYTENESGMRTESPAWSPDGKLIAYIDDKTGETEIYTVPQMGGTPSQLTNTPGGPSITRLTWSPDSKRIAFVTAGLDLDLLDVASKKVTTVFTDPYNPVASYDFSPDGKWIAYIGNVANQFGSLFLYNIDSGKTTQVTSGFYNDDRVAFDLTGKYLYLISDRTYSSSPAPFNENLFLAAPSRVYVLTLAKETKDPLNAEDDEETSSSGTQAGNGGRRPRGGGGGAGGEAPSGPPPTKIDIDGLSKRIIPLPMPPQNYSFIVGGANSVFIGADGTLLRYDLRERSASPVMMGTTASLAFNPERTKLAYLSGTTLGIADIHPGPPISAGEGRVDTSSLEAIIDPRAEWKQIFWESWRYERDHFYDKNFLGMNWNAIGKRYASYLPYIAHRSELNYVLGLMIGELGTSHAYVFGGDYGAPIPVIPTGQLGADYEAVGGKVRIKKLYAGQDFAENRRGPLSDPGVNVSQGDYILAIDGKPVDAQHSPDSRLVDKAGKEVVLTVNSDPSTESAHNVTVTPVATESSLRYNEWVANTRKYVAEKSGGRIGYVHVTDTSEAGMSGFLEGYYSQSDKQAVIIDERWNSGGQIPTFFTEWLARNYKAFMKSRYGAEVGFPTQILPPEKVMLINGYSGSGGDMFPYLFRQSKLGPLIGERTWGGLVGINGFHTLVDGGQISSPEAAFFDPSTGKWIAENNGIEPDIVVDARPDLVAKGQDPQLDAAIGYLLDKIKGENFELPKVPSYPRVRPVGTGN